MGRSYHIILLQLSTYKQNNGVEGRVSTAREITSWPHVVTHTKVCGSTKFRLSCLLIARDSRDWLALILVTCCPSPFYISRPCLGFDFAVGEG